MKNTIYDFDNYKSYVIEKINNSPSKGRGIKLKISEYLSCQTAYVSQVLNGKSNFSLEQAIKLNKFFDHTKDESHFFILLIHLERSGSEELSDYFKGQMKEIIKKRSDLKNRLAIKDSLKKVDQEIYYSSWMYAYIHMIVAIPEFRTPIAISRKMNVSREKIIKILTFLEETGLVQRNEGHYEVGVTKIHVTIDSPQINRHHTNWRLKAIKSIDINDSIDLHYSSIISMAQEDVPKVKEILIKAIEQYRIVVKDSKEEQMQVVCIDFFGA